MNATVSPNPRAIGALLIDAGRLTPEKAEQALRFAREKNLRFGDAALQLGLITAEDLDFALARQFDYAYLRPGDDVVADEVVAAFAPNTPAVEALRALRTQLMLRWFGAEAGNKALTIVSPERGEGRSWMAANLAVVFSQLGERTLLIDADMRHPRQHTLFRLDNRLGLSAVLTGRGGEESIRRITPLLGLSVLPAGATPPNAQELLSRPAFTQLLTHLQTRFDVIIIDSPAATHCADAQAIAARAGAAVLVARKNLSPVSRLAFTAQAITQAGAQLVGSVMNEH
ncbi:MAG: chain length determinant protein tyrosine kinase EpsG [Candidatus Dactylopiibacterium carminicum]|uniref:Chain length determinant protein tyrosine kinase EpsG n=1 Tax=Candidatus Dactylopiibacterium carminicum TaxID=857335 RepID=A0A272EPA5_9RHOO|nr:chain length determinant protein tyrosine kinase EpsG [Candidatus Dactylopiibacterium carminicum]KAF7598257.1 chain length determinant protein tyrosine kinase EpsG [Candidatus Dactylopiibacterium carminicum]PAS91944.1 MAG: chain length determinant protein tyrosine kinase EpsG [Candidatus Dactylopiibacterium carminicum]PAS94994.1 MAG: chain length determinant protein tyrosine kinase EpsG [Candidatus Dactylopiibacterium carminicum]PAS97140.1 MAG: chain length determinant protein tyrosine kinas